MLRRPTLLLSTQASRSADRSAAWQRDFAGTPRSVRGEERETLAFAYNEETQ